MLPDRSSIVSKSAGTLNVHGIPVHVNIFDNLDLHHSLISMNDFTKAGATVKLTDTDISIEDSIGDVILTHPKATTDNLQQTPVINNIVSNQIVAEEVAYHHAALGSPPVTSLIKAMNKGFLGNFPLRKEDLIRNKPNSVATAFGHLNQQRQNQRSTRPKLKQIVHQSEDTEYDDNNNDTTDAYANDEQISHAFIHVADEIIHSDATGRFPYQSKRGNNVIIVFCYKGFIHSVAAKGIDSISYQKAHAEAYAIFQSKVNPNNVPIASRLDNQVSAGVKSVIAAHDLELQLVPPYNHRTLISERGIQTVKNALISMLANAHPDFPIWLWDDAISILNVTLNTLLPFKPNPSISAYEGIYGHKHDFNKMPLGIFGSKVVVHESPDHRASFANHGVTGFYVGLAPNHYRCYLTYIPSTQAYRVSDSLAWFHGDYLLPNSDPDAILHNQQAKLLLELTNLENNSSDTAILTAIVELKDQLVLHQESNLVQRVPTPPPINANDLLLVPTTGMHTRAQTTIRNAQSINQQPTTSAVPMVSTISNVSDHLPTAATSVHTNTDNTITDDDIKQWNTFMEQSFASSAITNSMARDGPDKVKWAEADHKEWVKLIDTTATLVPIYWDDPHGKPTYYNPQRKIKSDGTYRTRGTAGGDRIYTDMPVKSDVASIQAVKTMLNSILSTENAKAATLDIDDFFISGTKLVKPEYMFVYFHQLSPEFQKRYSDPKYWQNDRMLFRVDKTIYGLPQSCILSQRDLIKLLASHGYHQLKCDSCIFSNTDKSVQFSLVVDDFLVKYTDLTNINHLITTLKSRYGLKVDMDAKKYLGITLKWDYVNRICNISMPGYVIKHLTARGYQPKKWQTHSAIKFEPLNYKKALLVADRDTTRKLTPAEKTDLQSIIGIFLYYARVIDCMILPAVSILATKQSAPTITDRAAAEIIMDYAYTYQDVSVDFHKSDMQATADSDATYLSEANASSRVAGLHYFGNLKSNPHQFVNGNVEVLCKQTLTKMTSACNSEYAGLFENSNKIIANRNLAEELGHHQEPSIIRTDNKCSHDICHRSCKMNKTKSMDMRYHVTRERQDTGIIDVQWGPGVLNNADLFTKIQPVKVIKEKRNMYVKTGPLTSVSKGVLSTSAAGRSNINI